MRIHDAHPAINIRLSQELWLDARTVSGGQTISGREQVVFSPLPLWRMKVSPLVTRDTQDSWRAWLAKLGGRSSAVRLSVRHRYEDIAAINARFGIPFNPTHWRGLPFASGKFFASGVGFKVGTPTASIPSSLSAFATTIPVSLGGLTNGFRDGDKIGIGGNFYVVTAVNGATIEIAPPLRKAIVAGSAITLSPSIVMQMTSDDQGRPAQTGGSPFVSVSFELVELPELV